jgi:hypothetical protein
MPELWLRTDKFDPACARLADNHYSRRTSLNDALKEAWQSQKFEPNSIVIPLRVFVYLRRPYMTKRGFRRWRAMLRKRARA